MTTSQIIKEVFEKNNLSLTDQQIKSFEKFYELLIETNEKFNLTAITDIYEVASKHFVDSVLAADLLTKDSSILDIGCGAGFPSIPLAIIRPDLKFTLIDSIGKKINFVNEVIEKLNLKNVNAIHTRAQEFCTAQTRSAFDFTISRAVAPLNVLLEINIPFLKSSGAMIAYKGVAHKEELDTAKNAMNQLFTNNTRIIEKDLAVFTTSTKETQKRFILEFKKFKPTPNKYPRQKNLIKTNPL